MLSKYPNNYQLLFGYGNVLYNKKNFEQALKIYEQVILIKPNLASTYTNIAFIYEYHRIQKVKSIKWADRALLIHPNN
jgi:tetratricopeptide (TPR) repeat protein